MNDTIRDLMRAEAEPAHTLPYQSAVVPLEFSIAIAEVAVERVARERDAALALLDEGHDIVREYAPGFSVWIGKVTTLLNGPSAGADTQ